MTPAAEPDDTVTRAVRLAALFCDDPPAFGQVSAIAATDVPAVERTLLDHRSHMTVTMERHHRCLVGLRVVAERDTIGGGIHRYAREILLTRPDGGVVQYGIVRIDLATVDPATAAAIRDRAAPLGRILLAAGLLCDVQRVKLLRIDPGAHLRDLLATTAPLHGRVAEIAVDGRPAIELLEVVVPPV